MSHSSATLPARLHPTAEAVYRYIIRYKRQHAGESPTRREIAAGVGIAPTSIVHHHLVVLERAGWVRVARPGGRARMIAIPGAEWRFDEAGLDDGDEDAPEPTLDALGADSL